jgi:hypothetical protein
LAARPAIKKPKILGKPNLLNNRTVKLAIKKSRAKLVIKGEAEDMIKRVSENKDPDKAGLLS